MKINIRTPINGLGYGVVGKNIVKSLHRLNYDVTLFPIGYMQFESQDESEFFSSLSNKAKREKCDFGAPSLTIWHEFDLSLKVGNGVSAVLPIFETWPLNKHDMNNLAWHDIIFATTSKNEEEIKRGFTKYNMGYKPVHKITLGFDPKIFNIDCDVKPDPHVFTFLNIGKWEKRKGHDILIEAFNAAFTENDNVRLWMMCHNPFLAPGLNNGIDENTDWEKKYKQTKLGHKITFLPRAQTHKEVAKIMHRADCGIFLSRAEGANLELLEMLACGKPCIATQCNGHTEYLNDELSICIPLEKCECANDGKWFRGDKIWNKIDDEAVEKISNYMNLIYISKFQSGVLPPFNKCKINKSVQNFTWDECVKNIINIISNREIESFISKRNDLELRILQNI